MRLDDVIKDVDTETLILENLRRCSKIVGKEFKAIFWHKDVSENIIKSFIKRNEKLLFDISTKITKEHDYGWLVIDTRGEDKSRHRYLYHGGIVSGIVQYIELIKVMKNREKNESSHSR